MIAWRKSSFSDGANACVEVGWRKSSFSGGGGNCVEVTRTSPGVAVRDSKHPAGPPLAFAANPWRTFLVTSGRS